MVWRHVGAVRPRVLSMRCEGRKAWCEWMLQGVDARVVEGGGVRAIPSDGANAGSLAGNSVYAGCLFVRLE